MPANRIDLVFDTTKSPSIKDMERDHRTEEERALPIKLTGPNQRTPSDLKKFLRNDSFKQEIVRFSSEEFEDDSLAEVYGEKVVRIGAESTCFLYKVHNGKVIKQEDHELSCPQHEEADTKMLVHVASIPCPATVVIRTSDTDVLVIALGNSSKFPDCQLYLEVGHKRNNTLRFIDITSLSMKLGSTLCKALSGFHAFTGSDYTPAFSYKGKVRPLKILEKNDKYMEAFGLLGSSESLSTALVSDIEEFVCEMYGNKRLSSVNEARFLGFMKVLLPPCSSVLMQQIMRANCICSIWNHANEKKPSIFNPEKNGWILRDNKFTPNWFIGELTPPTLQDMLAPEEVIDSEDDEDTTSHCEENEFDGDSTFEDE
ncbi:hypothetical protein GHT06_005149 [Daphnia sinensis]|uniref:Uncharacterized protein n=1 Tax=Daphnia sinensis TaxID=1820382 RepID=A0AAD5KUJ7_9CRUS|nr:hypothetical protein GHT06_005149 [Daphnia sinensis]